MTDVTRRSVAIATDDPSGADRLAAELSSSSPMLEVVAVTESWPALLQHPAFPTAAVVLSDMAEGRTSIEARVRTCRAAGAVVIVLFHDLPADAAQRAQTAGAYAVIPASAPFAAVRDALLRALGIRAA